MMRTILIVSLILLVALSFGCSKKKEQAPKPETQTQQMQADTVKAGTVMSTLDPITGQEVDGGTPYKYEYNGVLYLFSTAENMETFKADPTKYIPQR
jgi:YHS domain-containing protein